MAVTEPPQHTISFGPHVANDAELRLVGDAYAPRSVMEAVYEGRVAGCTIGDPDAPLPAQPEVKVYF